MNPKKSKTQELVDKYNGLVSKPDTYAEALRVFEVLPQIIGTPLEEKVVGQKRS